MLPLNGIVSTGSPAGAGELGEGRQRAMIVRNYAGH
jgi:hypothetical protein